ncbi:MAG: aminotransferase class I/II-fold pyridoxal phosphate-dependent enzyme [Bacteroidota bacterium]
MHPRALLDHALDAIDAWEASYGDFAPHAATDVPAERVQAAMDEYLARITAPPRGERPGTYPFFHPRYAGQMLKPPHPIAVAAYAAAMRTNPNNHALDGGPPTGQMEKEVTRDLAALFDFPDGEDGSAALGHLTSGGTIANLEALFAARELAPGTAIASSADAHYTHARMAHVLGVEHRTVAADSDGRIDLNALEDALAAGGIGTVVLTGATTGLGVVDPLQEAIPLCRQYGARVHIDAAYGGFFRLLANEASAPAGFPHEAFHAMRDADSIVVDPHKHGLQPYGCGAVLFRDPAVGRFYKHDSPYTYFSSDELHLGEISLECSRAGAAAGALWLTLRCLPLRADEGLGPILAATLRAARLFAAQIDASDAFTLYAPPETDIVAYFPTAERLSDIDAMSAALFDASMQDPDDPVFLSLYRMSAAQLHARHPNLVADVPHARVLRSVLMKPEHEHAAGWLVERLHVFEARHRAHMGA